VNELAYREGSQRGELHDGRASEDGPPQRDHAVLQHHHDGDDDHVCHRAIGDAQLAENRHRDLHGKVGVDADPSQRREEHQMMKERYGGK